MLPDWAPKLTEAWASAYLQILFGMLVFAIGIPALITQLIMQEDIRQIVQRWHILFCVGVCIPILLALMLFVWLLHPTADEKPATAAPAAASAPASAVRQAGSPPYDMNSNVAAILLTIIPLFSLALFLLLHFYRREAIVNFLKKKLLGSLSAKGRLHERSLKDLLYLGEMGNAGREKDLVLDAIKEIAAAARKSAKYTGDQLDELLHGLPVMLANKEKPGDDGNFNKAAYILQRVKDDFPKDDHHSTRDERTADDMLMLLGKEAVELGLASAPFTFVQFAEPGEQDMVFEIGLSALRVQRFDLAVASLRQLEAMAAERGSLSASNDETTAHLLGLLAHFAAHSFSTCRQAERGLLAIADSCSPSLSACLDYAFDFHYQDLRFDTSDSLVRLQRALQPEVAGLSDRFFPA
ncbi:MAG: hypothetical protein ACREEM_05590 [Blastocatellia bacterium]